ncbi:hypothetical protein BLNAU_16209 [Blattamonas nauphoetae]|uniref:Uncharacterized protein n=1 Tax=Blattamonas nauphoetae TaxID=2049346 RepID=A0ABQ9XEZ5_9EUKA|nr:hypothetical protein BLNAU_16209 [Blattamonas nauphoetae]
MTEISKKPDTSSSQAHSDLSSPQFPLSMDCSPFLNWTYNPDESESEKAVIFRSLVATVKVYPALNDSLEAKAVEFLESVVPDDEEPMDSFLRSLGSNADESVTCFVQSIVVLLSSPSQIITAATIKMLDFLIYQCSAGVRYPLVQADLIPLLINILNPQSLSFVETKQIHINLMKTIRWFVWLSTPSSLKQLGVQDINEQQAVRETILQQVLIPSEKYIWHLCVNRSSIIDGDQSGYFLTLLAHLLRICPYYQPTMKVVLHMPVFFTIPSSGMEQNRGRNTTDGEDSASNVENGGHRRCDRTKTTKRQKRVLQQIYCYILDHMEQLAGHERSAASIEADKNQRIFTTGSDFFWTTPIFIIAIVTASIFPTSSHLSNLDSGRSINTPRIAQPSSLAPTFTPLPVSDPTPPDIVLRSFTTFPCRSLPLPRAYTTWMCQRRVGCGSDLEAMRKDSAQMESTRVFSLISTMLAKAARPRKTKLTRTSHRPMKDSV